MAEEIKPLTPEDVDGLKLDYRGEYMPPFRLLRTRYDIVCLIETVRDRELQRDDAIGAAKRISDRAAEALRENHELQTALDAANAFAQRRVAECNELHAELDKTAGILGDAIGGASGTLSDFASTITRQLAELRAAINPDGTLTEHSQFVETAQDGQVALEHSAEYELPTVSAPAGGTADHPR